MASAWGRLFSSVGQSLEDIQNRKLREREREEELAFRKLQEDNLVKRYLAEEQHRAALLERESARDIEDKRRYEAGRKFTEASTARGRMTPGQALTPQQLDILKGTIFEQDVDQTLPSRQFGTISGVSPARSFLRPTPAEEEALQERIFQRKVNERTLGEPTYLEKKKLETEEWERRRPLEQEDMLARIRAGREGIGDKKMTPMDEVQMWIKILQAAEPTKENPRGELSPEWQRWATQLQQAGRVMSELIRTGKTSMDLSGLFAPAEGPNELGSLGDEKKGSTGSSPISRFLRLFSSAPGAPVKDVAPEYQETPARDTRKSLLGHFLGQSKPKCPNPDSRGRWHSDPYWCHYNQAEQGNIQPNRQSPIPNEGPSLPYRPGGFNPSR